MTHLYVDTDGCDFGDGSVDRPFATLERARDAVRGLRDVTVVLRGGIHYRREPFLLGREDSGVVYTAAMGEDVRLSGGVGLSAFRPVSDPEVLARLDPAARDYVMEVDLRAAGVSEIGDIVSRGFDRPIRPAHSELFFGGRRMHLARWPNDGDAKIAGVPSDQAVDDGHGRDIGKLEDGFYYDTDRLCRWCDTSDIWIHGFWAWEWANSYEQIDVLDPERQFIRAKPPYGLYGYRPGGRIFFINILEELDQPGEYFIDRKREMLYFWPPEPVDKVDVTLSVMSGPLVQMEGTSDVVIQGITLEATRGSAIEMSGGRKNSIEDCTIRQIGNWAVLVNGGAEHSVVRCHIHEIGDGGINLIGGDRKTLEPGGHVAEGNHIHDYGQWSKCYQHAIWLVGVGGRAADNHIHDGPHCAIQINGNDHIIECNEIHHVCMESGDVGAFYIGRDYSYCGNVVKDNHFHDIGGFGGDSNVIYLDDCASGVEITGNRVERANTGVRVGGGRDNIITGNIFRGCKHGIYVDSRGTVESPTWHDMVYVTMRERLEAMDYLRPPYSERYPRVLDIAKYLIPEEPGVPPEGNVIRRNTFACERPIVTTDWNPVPDGMLDIGDNAYEETRH